MRSKFTDTEGGKNIELVTNKLLSYKPSSAFEALNKITWEETDIDMANNKNLITDKLLSNGLDKEYVFENFKMKNQHLTHSNDEKISQNAENKKTFISKCGSMRLLDTYLSCIKL